jgi:hypothetical protein
MDPKKRNIIIAIVVVGIILLGFLSNWYLASQKQSSVTTTGPSPTGIITNGSMKPSFIPPNPSLMPKQVVPAWKEGDTDTFSIQFPSTWSPNVSSVAGGGITATFQPTGAFLFPRFGIEADPEASTAAIQERIKTLAPLHLQIQQIQFQGIPATSLEGTLPFPIADEHGIKNNVYKKFIFFVHNHNIYSINYAYNEDNQVTSNQEIFSIMLATLKLK